METFLYLSLLPEALIASQLDPEAFGVYYACGDLKKSRSEALFLELDPKFSHPYFDIEAGYKRLTPHEDGSPKRSVYISIYRVLEHVPLDAVRKLHVTTQDGRTLSIAPTRTMPKLTESLHLYQEIAPVYPRAVSSLDPVTFFKFLSDPQASMVTIPVLFFVELELGELARDPEMGSAQGLPYSNIDHYRQCLIELKTKPIQIKMVDRLGPVSFAYRTIKSGFYLGNQEDIVFFPMPSEEELRAHHYRWWRSAQM